MSFKKRKKKLWEEVLIMQDVVDDIVDDALRDGLTDEVGTLLGLLDSIKPDSELCEGRDMLQYCREELDKVKSRIFKGEKNDTWGKTVERVLNKNGNNNKQRKIGFHANFTPSVGRHNTVNQSSGSTPSINDIKLVDNLVCIKEGTNSVFKLVFNKETYTKMMMYTKLINLEITGLLEVRVERNQFYIDDIHIFRQKVSGAQCEMEDDLAIVELMNKMIEKGKNPGSLKCWWHSHNTMGVSPSGTDATTAEKFANQEFLITLITNHRGEIYTKLNFYKPVVFEIEGLSVYVDYTENREKLLEECKSNIQEMVKTSYYSYVSPSIYSGYSDYEDYPLYSGYEKKDTPKKLLRSEVGDNYIEGNLKYIWNENQNKYDIFTVMGIYQTEEDCKALGAREIENDIADIVDNRNELFNK